MRQLFSQAISNIALNVKNWMKVLFSKQVGMAIAALSLMVVTTACNKSGPSGPEVVGSSGSYDQRKGQQTELYDGVQPNAGGMNQHNDDFRYDKGESQDKAEKLIRQADRNLDKVQSPKDYVENLKDQAKPVEWSENFAKDAKENVEKVTTDLAKGTERGAKNLKENAKRSAENVQQSADNTADRARRAGEDVAKTTRRAVDDATDRS